MADTITFTLVKSGIGSTKKIRATLTGLGAYQNAEESNAQGYSGNQGYAGQGCPSCSCGGGVNVIAC
jgi:hypothetical protein